MKAAGPGHGLAAAVLGVAACAAPAAAQALSGPLTAQEARTIAFQAASEAQRLGLRATVAVVDAEGTLLALFRMDGAPEQAVVEGQPRRSTLAGCGGEGLEGLALPSTLVAITKAGTGAFLSSGGNAFSSRTASFIVQQHFPPAVDGTPGGPLFGVQFSSLGCTDVKSPARRWAWPATPGACPSTAAAAWWAGWAWKATASTASTPTRSTTTSRRRSGPRWRAP